MSLPKPATKLSQRIKDAIHDGILTQKEHSEIVALAQEDGRIDDEERRLLHELFHLIEHGGVKIAP